MSQRIFIQATSDTSIVHEDTITYILTRGTNTYDFTGNDWSVSDNETYIVGAEILIDEDDPIDNAVAKPVQCSDYIYVGQPPVIDFSDSGIILGNTPPNDYPGKNTLPLIMSKISEDDWPPEWNREYGYDCDDDGYCARIPATGFQGPHKDWLICKFTGATFANPVVEFCEMGPRWNEHGHRHEFYIQYEGEDFNYLQALQNEAHEVHIPHDHPILPASFSTYSIELPNSIEPTDVIHFAWRYFNDFREDSEYDIWRIDHIVFYEKDLIFPYLLGDANMAFVPGIWPPQRLGGDVTYLVNYFGGGSVPECFMHNPTAASTQYLWASADVNGDCNVWGSDVTKLKLFFSDGDSLSYCIDYPPLWLDPADCPTERPDVWPGCVTPPPNLSGNTIVIPTTLDKKYIENREVINNQKGNK